MVATLSHLLLHGQPAAVSRLCHHSPHFFLGATGPGSCLGLGEGRRPRHSGRPAVSNLPNPGTETQCGARYSRGGLDYRRVLVRRVLAARFRPAAVPRRALARLGGGRSSLRMARAARALEMKNFRGMALLLWGLRRYRPGRRWALHRQRPGPAGAASPRTRSGLPR